MGAAWKLFLLVGLAAGAGAMSAQAADIKSSEAVLPRKGAPPGRVQVFEFAPLGSTVEVLMTKSMKGDHDTGDTGISVRKAADFPAITRRVMSRALLFNGGFSTAKTDRPIGLLISNGNVANVPSYVTRPAEPASACKYRTTERYRFGGVMCVRKDRSVAIGKIESVDLSQCRQAIQSGPLLVEEPGEIGVCEAPEESAATRTVVCVAGDRVKVVLALDPVSLFDLATWLADTRNGLGCRSAINLSGDAASGAVFYRGGIRSFTDVQKVGEGRFPQASLILVHSFN